MPSRGPWAVDVRHHGPLHLLARVLGSFAAGLAVGFTARVADHALAQWGGLAVALASHRTLLSAVVSGLITVTAFTLWMRTVMAGMLAGQVSPRVLSAHLDDRYQQAVLDAMSAALAVAISALVTLPAEGPVTVTVSLPLTMVVTVTALAGILIALTRAVQDLAIPNLLVRQIEHGRRLLRQRQARQQRAPGGDQAATAAIQHTIDDVRSDTTGWVTVVDHEALLDAVPSGTGLILRTRPGQLISPDDVLVSATSELTPAAKQRVRASVHVGRHRNPDEDIDHLVNQMVDMAAHALTTASSDTSTADEAMRAVGILLSSLVRTGEPVRQYAVDGSLLFDVAALGVRETIRANVERLRMAAATHPRSAHQFVEVVGTLAAAARASERTDILEDLREQAARLLESARDSDLSASDVTDLRTRAQEHGLAADG